MNRNDIKACQVERALLDFAIAVAAFTTKTDGGGNHIVRKYALICFVLVSGLLAFGHGDVHEQIATLTREIQTNPSSAELHLKRGELHRVHQDWPQALSDFDRALSLNPKLTSAEFCRGRTLFDRGDWNEARGALDRFLEKQPGHIEARVVRARTLAKLKLPQAAAKDFTAAMGRSAEPNPELFFERAQTLAAADGAFTEEALRGLEEGILRCGPLVTLELPAIDLELKLKRYDAALKRIDLLADKSPRKERWLLRRGEIEVLACRPADARRSFEAALSAVEKLPEHLRRTRAVQEIDAQVRKNLKALEAGEISKSQI